MGQVLTERQFDTVIVSAGLTQQRRTEIGRWLARKDGVAIYRNTNPDSPTYGCREFVSYGGRHATIKQPVPPKRVKGTRPDMRYELEGYYPGFIRIAG